MSILNNPAVSLSMETSFRASRIQRFAATEEAYIQRYIRGEKELMPDKDFSSRCLKIYRSYKERG